MATRSLIEFSDLIQPSRRSFLAALGLVLIRPRSLWAAAASPDEVTKIVGVLCDRFVPKYASHPGAVALGVVPEVVGWFREHKLRSLVLDSTVSELGKLNFLELPPEAQERFLADYVDSKNRSATGAALRMIRNSTVVMYFSKAESWIPIGYTQPQPKGYPDYAECETRKATDGQAG